MRMSSKRGGDIVKVRADDGDGLSHKQRAFVREYCVDLNGTQAAIRAGYSPTSAGESACELLKLPKVDGAIYHRLERKAAAADVDATFVISELRALALADPRDLVSIHRGACRYCHGVDHDRQWTQGEYKNAFYEAKAADPNAAAPPLRGGLGYDFTREPNPECPECRGEGIERTIVKDTRKLSRGAAKLIAGVRKTKDGIELRSRDQDGALMALGKIVGVFIDRSELSGPGGSPLQLQPVQPLEQLTPEQLEQIIRASGHAVLQGHASTAPLSPLQLEAITRGSK
jgi:phage terminase small subunit